MRKLILTCDCGERMKVPRSAVGKTGVCPSCGRRIAITAGNTVGEPADGKPAAGRPAPERPRQNGGNAREDA
ncbi:MAG: hypothetical protein JXR94_07165, partial [Candidatus Hydrogenedentes bacterium]|nr:hypothetical protein [Candidatus Hydrogenedentota bacterium]